MSLAAWLVVGALMVVCGLAMARMMWMADGRRPLRRRRTPGRGPDQSGRPSGDRDQRSP